jgi:phospholipid/cholesterol/gamma-HCH transport system substrate-binding protein
METRAHYVLIGAFVLSAVAAAFLFILWLSQTQREFDIYDIVFSEQVSGLTPGGAVQFNGIQVGEVDELSFDPHDPSLVVARIRIKKGTRVKADTKAELQLVGFTGLSIIQLVGGSPDQPDLKEISRGVGRIRAERSGFGKFLAGSGDIVKAANRLLSEENTAAFSRILLNLDTLTKTLADQHENIGKTAENAAMMTANLAETTASLNRVAGSLDDLVGRRAPATLAEAEATLKATRDLVDGLNAVVEENREPLRAFADQGLAQLGPTLLQARRTLRTLEEVLRELDRDPRGYLLGESTPRGEATPQ